MESAKFQKVVTRNKLGCDLIFSFFYSAVNSMRSDSKVRPFPQTYYKPDGIEKDFQALQNVCNEMPSLQDVALLNQPSDKCYKLLEWLYNNCDPSIYSLCDINNFPLPLDSHRPKYIVEISYSDHFEQVWESRKGTWKTDLAYHGSKLENFYSIARCGLQQIFSTNTNPLFGEGIYLSKDLPVSILYAPYGSGWPKSDLGGNLSIVAVCEYIVDPSKMKVMKNKSGRTVKDGYIIVHNSDSVRIKYLLVYVKRASINAPIGFHGKIFLILFVVVILISICYTNFAKNFLPSRN